MRKLFIFLALLLFTAPLNAGQIISSGERYSASFSIGEDYRLGIGEKIRVVVYNETSLSGEFQVNPGGKIAFPLLGDVNATNRTTTAVETDIRDRLADGYLVDPKVSIEITVFRPYFILGEVRTPQQYAYASGLTVLNAIAAAGGFTPRAEKKKVYIRKSGETAEQIFRLTPDLRLLPGDTIRIGERIF